MMTERLILTPSDKLSPTWRKLVDHMEAELNNCRGKNDSPKLTESETAAIRGQIQTLKALIALGNESPVIDD